MGINCATWRWVILPVMALVVTGCSSSTLNLRVVDGITGAPVQGVS